MRAMALALVAIAAIATTGCDQQGSYIPEFARKGGNAAARLSGVRAELVAQNFGEAADLAAGVAADFPEEPEAHVLLARAEARLGNGGSAVRALGDALAAGQADPRVMLAHPDFDDLRDQPDFARLVARFDPAPRDTRSPVQSSAARPRGTFEAGDVSITEDEDGHETIVAGDVILEGDL